MYAAYAVCLNSAAWLLYSNKGCCWACLQGTNTTPFRLPVEAHLAVIDCMILCRWRLRRRLCCTRRRGRCDVVDLLIVAFIVGRCVIARQQRTSVRSDAIYYMLDGVRELLSWRRLSQQLRFRAPGVRSAQSKITASLHWHSWRFHSDSTIVNVCIYADLQLWTPHYASHRVCLSILPHVCSDITHVHVYSCFAGSDALCWWVQQGALQNSLTYLPGARAQVQVFCAEGRPWSMILLQITCSINLETTDVRLFGL